MANIIVVEEDVQNPYEDECKILAGELSRFRRIFGLTLSELGSIIGTTKFTMGKIERSVEKESNEKREMKAPEYIALVHFMFYLLSELPPNVIERTYLEDLIEKLVGKDRTIFKVSIDTSILK